MTLGNMLVRHAVVTGRPLRRRRAVPAPHRPGGPTLSYTQALIPLLRGFDEIMADELRRAGVRTDAGADGVLPGTLSRAAARALARMLRLLDKSSILRAATTVGEQVVQHSGQQLARQLTHVLGIDPGTMSVDAAAQIASFRSSSLAQITTIAHDKVKAVFADVGVGARVETVAKRLEEEAAASPARAALIARDQVLTLNAQITRKRHEDLGITRYTWSTSGDARVRPDHKALNGKVFEYAFPPEVDSRTGARGNPGTYFQCRCVAIPVLPE